MTTRTCRLAPALTMLAALAFALWAAPTAHAGPADAIGELADQAPAQPHDHSNTVQPGRTRGHSGPFGAAPLEGAEPDRSLNKDSKGAALFFWLFALMIVSGSVFVITRSNLVTAVMGMIGTFFGIAAVYAMLYAKFLTAIQVLVYAGAIMVLFVFVIMILNRPVAEPWGGDWTIGGIIGKLVVPCVAVLYLLVRLGAVLWSIPAKASQLEAPRDVLIRTFDRAAGAEQISRLEFGSTKALGHSLFTDYLFPFEAVSLVLLIAVVGAVAVARPHERPPRPGEVDQGEEA